MIRKIFSGCLICLASALALRSAEPGIILRGIVVSPTNELALLEETPPTWGGNLILGRGQRERKIEVLNINPTAGKVSLRNGGVLSEIGFSTDLPPDAWVIPPSNNQAKPGKSSFFLRLQQAPLGEVFNLYQILAGRTLLRPGSLTTFRVDLGCQNAASPAELLGAIEQSLARQGLLFRQDGDRFEMVGKEGDLQAITPQLRQLTATLAETRGSRAPGAAEEILPAGAINFPGTDLSQVLMIYQELVNRTLLRPVTLPAPTISFRNYTPWSASEAIYAFNATFAFNGISAVPVGEKFLFVFPSAQRQKMESLLKWQMPQHTPSGKEPLPAGAITFASRWTLSEVLATYQEQCGKQVKAEADTSFIPFTFKNQTPLRSEELLHALDLLLGWNGLQVTQDDGEALRLIRHPD